MNILTEEELNKIDHLNKTDVLTYQEIEKVINSHRNLLSANAELSFKNGDLNYKVRKYQQALLGASEDFSMIHNRFGGLLWNTQEVLNASAQYSRKALKTLEELK